MEKALNFGEMNQQLIITMFDQDSRPVPLEKRFGQIKLLKTKSEFSAVDGAKESEIEVILEDVRRTSN